MKQNKAPKLTESLTKQYDLLNAPTKTSASRKIVIVDDLEGNKETGNSTVHVYPDKESPVDLQNIYKTFNNFDEFSSRPSQEILTHHANIFNEEPPKKQILITTALYVWAWFVKNGTPHIPESQQVDPVTGKKERKSSIKTRKYFLGTQSTLPEKCPAQMITCNKIFTELLNKSGKDSITEAELEAEIIQRTSELKTRQDPWRIFQYYRPRLIANKLIRSE
jgi:hypothetical protein